jgi:hypothetical protein
MSTVGLPAVLGLLLIMVALFLWIFMTMYARRNPVQRKIQNEQPRRGPASGGVMLGDPGQVIPTGEAPTLPAPQPRGTGRPGPAE